MHVTERKRGRLIKSKEITYDHQREFLSSNTITEVLREGFPAALSHSELKGPLGFEDGWLSLSLFLSFFSCGRPSIQTTLRRVNLQYLFAVFQHISSS